MIEKGRIGEQQVVDELITNGWLIIDRNVHTRYGELDIVAIKDDRLRFIEVKLRSSQRWLWDAVPTSKLKRMFRCVEVFLSTSSYKYCELELCTAIVIHNKIEWVHNCTDVEERWLYT